MSDKFIVPQFIDNEDKILGPITVRQFLICLGAVLITFIEYKLIPFIYFVPNGLLVIGLAGTFAFVKINGQSFHIFFVNFLQTQTRPKLRIWNKTLNDVELRQYLIPHKEEASAVLPVVKERPTMRRLRDMALTVNTGGVYTGDDADSS